MEKFLTDLYIELIEEAKAFSDQLVKEKEKFFQTLPAGMFQVEIRTLRIGGPRRSGHSTAMLELLSRYPQSLVVTPTQLIADRIKELARLDRQSMSVVTTHDLKIKTRGYTYSPYVFVECASAISHYNLDEIYDRFASHREMFFVLLG